ncbi:hypothetical protein [Curtobacterium sp. MCLR17_034]|uniref:hypothetical protein n=1 Tax=Curtobacterium sp. MCLR17_034 TaxID=2175623 RepID=UPI000DA8F313|nr:hypothetical protein [Curtobacterium sp. MCLR17_034]PZF11744.1 hypothetical protein DEI98_06390 [Curtobacterium sp. MCLR17_034]
MNDIQNARDVLAKWRKSAQEDVTTIDAVVSEFLPGNEALIIGTACNPDLLDAIDTMFRIWEQAAGWGARELNVDSIAAAILAADNRMGT